MFPIIRLSVVKIWSPNFPRNLALCTDHWISHCRFTTGHRLCLKKKEKDGITKANGETPDQVIEHLNKLIKGRVITIATKDEVQNRVKMLESLGLTLEDIVENANLIKLPERDILKHISESNNAKFSKKQIIDVLMKEAFTWTESNSNIAVSLHDIFDLLVTELKISHQDAADVIKKNPFVKRLDVKDLWRRILFLKQSGLSTSDILENFTALKQSVLKLQDMVSTIESFQENGLVEQDFNFAAWLCQTPRKNTIAKKTHWSQLPERAETLMKVMQVSKKDLQAVRYFDGVSLDLLVKKFDLMSGYGISGSHVINHGYIMQMPFTSIKEALKHATNCGVDHPSISELINYILFKKVPKAGRSPRQYSYLAKKLGMRCNELREMLDSKWMAERLTLKNNLEFLQEHGFSIQDIREFPMILGHDHECLKTFHDSLPDRQELQPYSEYLGNKRLILNALQYFMEQSVNFSGCGLSVEPEEEHAEGRVGEAEGGDIVERYLQQDDSFFTEEDGDEDEDEFEEYPSYSNSAVVFS